MKTYITRVRGSLRDSQARDYLYSGAKFFPRPPLLDLLFCPRILVEKKHEWLVINKICIYKAEKLTFACIHVKI